MSAKVTVREIDGTEYQLKKRIGQMIVEAGYAEVLHRGLIVMRSMNLSRALKIISDDRTQAGIGPDGCSLAVYPVHDQMTFPRPFGAAQNWSEFRV